MLSDGRWILLFVVYFFVSADRIWAQSFPSDGSPPGPSVPTLWNMAGLVALFGAFGGVVAALSEIPLRQIRDQGIKIFGGVAVFWSCIVISCLQGIAGALAFAGVSALDGKFDVLTQSKEVTFTLLSVATGFAGHKFLLLISRRLTKDIQDEIEQKTEKVRAALAEEAQKRTNLSAASTALIAAIAAADGSDQHLFKSTADEALKKAGLAFKDFPCERSLGILWARLEQRRNGYDSAIDILTKFIAGCRRNNQASGSDYAALLFNRACYRNRRAEQLEENHDAGGASKYRTEAWDDLNKSCQEDFTNKEEAYTDPDLKSLTNHQDFKSNPL